jgi:hypothetical protein
MIEFRRLILTLSHDAADPAMMREAASLARLLNAELHALFVEDEAVTRASALPFVREISPLSLQWRKLDPERLATEFRGAAEHARRHLVDAARAVGVRQHFAAHRGDVALLVRETCVASDIVVVGAPGGTGGVRALPRLAEIAEASVAAVLHLPPKVPRARGPVAAVVTDANDPALAVARAIAALGHERLLVLSANETGVDDTIRLPAAAGVSDIVSALDQTRERLIVLTRDGACVVARELAAARGVPVLVT